jgi:hypothetical protein
MCGGDCKNLRNDEANCGACGKSCPKGQPCEGGACKAAPPPPPPPPPMCPGGQTMCGGDCKNLRNDDANCGACGTACGNGFTCKMGACTMKGGGGGGGGGKGPGKGPGGMMK